jgi:methyl-accepting chemotaxis protein
MDAANISADNCCELGRWLHGDAKQRLGRFKSYTDCVGKHAAFHREAGKVAMAINAGKYAEAGAMLEGATPYAAASSAVGSALLAMRKETAAVT